MADIIIPVYRPDEAFRLLLQKLQEQTLIVHKVIIANTEQPLWEEYLAKNNLMPFLEQLPYELEVFHVNRKEFDHGGTRRLAVCKSQAPCFICMTQDALPADEHLVERLLEPLSGKRTAVSYGRQAARPDCSVTEACTRSFNYPAESTVKSKADLERMGIKTFFCSNVCAAYRRDIYEELGGFEEHTIFNEDMIYAGHAVLAGYEVAYAAEAVVLHSHNYTGRQQYHRNFDLAVSQQQHPEVFAGIRSESEGIRMVKKTAGYLLTIKKPWLIVNLLWQSAWKYLGYRAGRNYETMKKKKILKLTMNREYWYSMWEREHNQEE